MFHTTVWHQLRWLFIFHIPKIHIKTRCIICRSSNRNSHWITGRLIYIDHEIFRSFEGNVQHLVILAGKTGRSYRHDIYQIFSFVIHSCYRFSSSNFCSFTVTQVYLEHRCTFSRRSNGNRSRIILGNVKLGTYILGSRNVLECVIRDFLIFASREHKNRKGKNG